jgi:hypothetical protein
MSARFTQGTNERSTRVVTQRSPVGTARGSGRGKAGGMPGYIKTRTDSSSGGLANSKPVGPRFNVGMTSASTNKTTAMRAQGAYIGKKGTGSAAKKFSAGKFRGSSDKSYRATSMGAPGSVRTMGQPKAPPSRAASEKEGGQTGRSGSKRAVSSGGDFGANKLPPGGAKAGAGRGTMESLRGRATMGSGKKSMY